MLDFLRRKRKVLLLLTPLLRSGPCLSIFGMHAVSIQVRFSNKESIDDYVPGMEEFLPWEDATGEWVHVEIVTVFGKSMEVSFANHEHVRAGKKCAQNATDSARPSLPARLLV